MHAGTEQLLTMRDGGPVDAGIAQHVADCADCRDQLAQLRVIRNELRNLPRLSAPPGGWARLSVTLDEPDSGRHRWLAAAVAAAALVAVALWQFGGGSGFAPVAPASDGPEQIAINETASDKQSAEIAVLAATEAETADLDTLVSQSRRLERLLRELNSNTPQVMNAGTAGTIAGLQDGIAYIDYGLNYDERLDQTQSEQLWRQRVGLMNTLVQVRGAQLQQISN